MDLSCRQSYENNTDKDAGIDNDACDHGCDGCVRSGGTGNNLANRQRLLLDALAGFRARTCYWSCLPKALRALIGTVYETPKPVRHLNHAMPEWLARRDDRYAAAIAIWAKPVTRPRFSRSVAAQKHGTQWVSV
jgi:hypothetical protein